MKRLNLVFSILLLTGAIVFSQKFTISGYIEDTATREKLIGANVFSQADLTGTVSNSYGFFSISLTAGDRSLFFSYVGYQTKELEIQLNKDLQEINGFGIFSAYSQSVFTLNTPFRILG